MFRKIDVDFFSFSRYRFDVFRADAKSEAKFLHLCTFRTIKMVIADAAHFLMNLHRFWDGVITSSQNLTRLRNEATALRNRQEFQRSQLTELANTDFESWAKESFEIAGKFAYRNDGRIGIPKGGNKDCTMVAAAPVLPAGYVTNASRIADRRIILAGYRLADLLTRLIQN
jgi:hypothetical protein